MAHRPAAASNNRSVSKSRPEWTSCQRGPRVRQRQGGWDRRTPRPSRHPNQATSAARRSPPRGVHGIRADRGSVRGGVRGGGTTSAGNHAGGPPHRLVAARLSKDRAHRSPHAAPSQQHVARPSRHGAATAEAYVSSVIGYLRAVRARATGVEAAGARAAVPGAWQKKNQGHAAGAHSSNRTRRHQPLVRPPDNGAALPPPPPPLQAFTSSPPPPPPPPGLGLGLGLGLDLGLGFSNTAGRALGHGHGLDRVSAAAAGPGAGPGPGSGPGSGCGPARREPSSGYARGHTRGHGRDPGGGYGYGHAPRVAARGERSQTAATDMQQQRQRAALPPRLPPPPPPLPSSTGHRGEPVDATASCLHGRHSSSPARSPDRANRRRPRRHAQAPHSERSRCEQGGRSPSKRANQAPARPHRVVRRLVQLRKRVRCGMRCSVPCVLCCAVCTTHRSCFPCCWFAPRSCVVYRGMFFVQFETRCSWTPCIAPRQSQQPAKKEECGSGTLTPLTPLVSSPALYVAAGASAWHFL